MQTAELDYPLPDRAVAQAPAEPRDAARLLVDRGPDRPPGDLHVHDLPSLVRPGDVVVVNTTRVLPARLHLRKPTGGAVEVLLLERLEGPGGSAGTGGEGGTDRAPPGAGPDPSPAAAAPSAISAPPATSAWVALVRPGRRVAAGTVLEAGPDLQIEVGGDAGGEAGAGGARHVTLRFPADRRDVDVLSHHGVVPLPPYITEPLDDPERYQTVFAERPGSVAAPTAGLHLTPAVLDRCRGAGAEVAPVELVVGLATFRPIATAEVEDHLMHTERYRVPDPTWAACRRAAAAGGRVVAVGTTSVRALESVAVTGHLEGRTELFIRRPYPWQVVDVLLTNFHLPRSSLLVLVDAFVGSRWRGLYDHALTAGYRFLSFGDAMWLERSAPGGPDDGDAPGRPVGEGRGDEGVARWS